MVNGYVMVVRDRETGGIYVETTDDWEGYMAEGDKRLIYCQAVADVGLVQETIDQWSDDDLGQDANDRIAHLVSAAQWVANEHPLRGFRNRGTI
jgi:hypothetical protein